MFSLRPRDFAIGPSCTMDEVRLQWTGVHNRSSPPAKARVSFLATSSRSHPSARALGNPGVPRCTHRNRSNHVVSLKLTVSTPACLHYPSRLRIRSALLCTRVHSRVLPLGRRGTNRSSDFLSEGPPPTGCRSEAVVPHQLRRRDLARDPARGAPGVPARRGGREPQRRLSIPPRDYAELATARSCPRTRREPSSWLYRVGIAS